jgi:hypothetical protein
MGEAFVWGFIAASSLLIGGFCPTTPHRALPDGSRHGLRIGRPDQRCRLRARRSSRDRSDPLPHLPRCSRPRFGINRGVKSPADPRKPFIYRPGGLGRPVSRILLYPVIHLRCSNVLTRPYTGPLEEPRLPARRGVPRNGPYGTFWLARTGCLPGRSLAGYRRWALTPPFHPSPVPCRDATCCVSTGHRLVCSLLHLTWRRACAIAAPRVVGPSGLCYESGLCSISWKIPGHSDGSDGPDPALDYTAVGQTLGCRRRAREPLRLRRTILVGVRRNSTLSVSLQRFCQRGSSPTAGSNQTPGPSSSITPS